MKIPRLPVIATHLIGWTLFQSLPLIFLLSMPNNSITETIGSFAYWKFCLYYLVIFYVHQSVLLPKLYHRKRKALYIASLALVLLSALYLRPFDNLTFRQRQMRYEMRVQQEPPPPNTGFKPRPPEEGFRQQPPMGEGRRPFWNGGGPQRFPGRWRLDIISIFLLVMVVMFGIANDISKRSRLAEQRAAQAEADRANAELSFLKAQINPHFLFNTLNNIYSMAVTKNEHTADMLMKLSNIMRYVTDDVNADYVPLQNEIDCISDYIDLQKLRLEKRTRLIYTVSGDPSDKTIAPLLLMTFVENVFKYGVSKQEDSELLISLSITDDKICFYTTNSIFPQQKQMERTGIGISNTRKRLEHLYAGKHSLQVTDRDNIFHVELCLYNS